MKAPLAILALLQFAAASAQTAALPVSIILERTIESSALPGDLVTFADSQCRYSGQLIRDPVDGKSVAGSLMQFAGADGGTWHADLSRRVCAQLEQPVRLRVDLPKAPSLVGGGGIPPNPYGYQAGTKFVARPS